jgi:ABC-type Fe3+-hydroxamate transport system substrate-binding protein
LSEAIVELDLRERLVGVTAYCVHPAGAFEGLPSLGGTKDADVEAIAALAPDLVIANQEENTQRVVRTLAEQGIDVWVTYPRTVREGVDLLEEMAGLGASPAAIDRVVKPVQEAYTQARAAGLRRQQAGLPRPRVFCPIWRDPWMTIGRDTYIHDLLDLCGAENVFANAGDRRYPLLDLDDLLRSAPDLILLPDEPYAFGQADVEELARLDLPASRTSWGGSSRGPAIHLIDGTLVSWYGPRIAEAIRVLAGLFAIS